MPGFSTHYLFGSETYKSVRNKKARRIISGASHAYSLGLQGPDVFFYYMPSYLYHPQNIGEMAHHFDTKRFFTNLAQSRFLFEGKPDKQLIADAYILGFLGHYTLDTHTHPFVYAFTHYDADNPPSTKDYFGQHTYLETELDNMLVLKFRGLKPTQFHMNATIRLTHKERRVIGLILAYAYMATYTERFPKLKVTTRQTRMATRWMYVLTRLMRDPTGKRKVLVRSIEKLLIGKPMFSPMVPSDQLQFVRDPMNLLHRKWIHPWTKEVSDADFEDLMQAASVHYIARIDSYLEAFCGDRPNAEALQEAFLKEYGNKHFSSGLEMEE